MAYPVRLLVEEKTSKFALSCSVCSKIREDSQLTTFCFIYFDLLKNLLLIMRGESAKI